MSATTSSIAENASDRLPTIPEVHERTGMSCEEDLYRETDHKADFTRHHFLHLDQPLFPQIWFGNFKKDFYLDQIHRPRHYRGGKSAPFFGNFLEPFTKTAWWLIPALWLPVATCGMHRASSGFSSMLQLAVYGASGTLLWTLVEYCLHRFLFHLDYYLPDNRLGITLHFCLHGVHHYLPMDRYRLVMPPALGALLAFPLWLLAHAVFQNWHTSTAIYWGALYDYVCYDLTHYFLHHARLPSFVKGLKKHHMAHHYLDYNLAYGITSRFWDFIFGTEMPASALK